MSGPVMSIDGRRLQQNLTRIRETVAPAQPMLVMKDDAYRHGAVTLAGPAWDAGVRWFGAFDVGCADLIRRGLRGRDRDAEARVFVWTLGGDEDIVRALRADADLGVGDLALLEDVARVAGALETTARVHLKIDSGLRRNGIRPEAWPAALARAARLEATGAIRVVGVWSHIAEASDDEDDAAHRIFRDGLAEVERAGLRIEVRHLAASAAAFARPEFRYDLVRVGAFAYGIPPAGGPSADDLGIVPIARVSAPIVEVTATRVWVAVGALDGIPTPLVGALVGTPTGHAPILEITMDRLAVPAWDGARVGQEIVLYGGESGLTATDLAEHIDSIGEEIALRVGASRNVEKTYRLAP